MTFPAALAWSGGRAVLIALAVLPVCVAVARWLQGEDGVVRRARLLAVALPFLFPELLVGYAYAPWVAGRPLWSEWACAGLMALRAIPVGVVAWLLTPPSAVTPSALYCRGLQLRTWRDRGDWLRLWLVGPVWSAVPAVALVWLVSFQQFELAALLLATSWSDWLFVQQVGGLSLAASLQAALIPALGQLAVLSLGLLAVTKAARDTQAVAVPVSRSAGETQLTTGYLIAAWVVVIGWPTLSLVAGLPAGFRHLSTQPLRMQGLARELFAGLAAAVLAALLAWWLARVMSRGSSDHEQASARWRSRLWWVLCLPGLLGSLVLGLGLVALFQTPPLGILYNTPLPWLLGLVLFLLPRGVLLQAWSASQRPHTAAFLADQLASSVDTRQQAHGRWLQWRLIEEPRFLAVAVLVVWGYLDLTTAYLLAPTGLTSGIVRLYNFMHFGRTAALSAEAFVLLAGPLLIAAAFWPLWRRGRA